MSKKLLLLRLYFRGELFIYVIICSGCSEEYTGQTGVQRKERLSIYWQHIRQRIGHEQRKYLNFFLSSK